MHTYNFNKVCEPNRLRLEISDSAITVAIDNIVVQVGVTYIDFKASLSTEEAVILNALVTAHVATPLNNDATIVDIKTTPAFAQPTHRTKWNGSEVISVSENAIGVIDYQLVVDRASFGGMVVFNNAKMGDWIECMIVDDEVTPTIPEPYRASMTENWPIINQYIYRYNIPEGSSSRELNTYPLIADLKAGWKIRIKYHASDIVGVRKVSTNLYLLQKL